MAMTDRDEIELRWPTSVRLGYAGLFAAWVAMVVSIVVAEDGRGPSAVLYLLLVAGFVAFLRVLRISVRTRGDRIEIRNSWKTYRLGRADIVRFGTDRYQRPGGRQRAHAELRDGPDVLLFALESPLFFARRDPGPAVGRLNGWLAG